jgi:2-succinyl-6-hydroxy-2,4-cyclohexadiene-1-carboxylate synthase
LASSTIGSGDRLVMVHGFTQTRRCWGSLDQTLAPGHEVVTVDAPGHGESTDIAADLWTTAELLVTTGERATYLGYSMGGRMVLHAALDHPGEVERLVLISATAGIEDDVERAVRRRADDERADRLEQIGVDAFLDEWLAQPMFDSLPLDNRDLDERRHNTASGLASSLRRAGTGAQEPLWDRLSELSMPVLLVTGSLDEKFSRVAGRMAEGIGDNARWVLMSGGHTVHREATGFADLLTDWLAETA